MKLKIFILFFLVLSLISAPAWAMDSRKAVLNGTLVGDNDSAGLVLDSGDSFVNPAYLTKYGNLLGVEGSTDLVSGFAFVDLDLMGLFGNFGVHANRNFGMKKTSTLTTTGDIDNLELNYLGAAAGVNLGSDFVNINSLNNVVSWGVLYALSMGDTLKFGFAFNYIGNSVEGNVNSNPTNLNPAAFSKSISDLEIRLGTVLNLEIFQLAGDVGIGFPTYIYSLSVTNEEADFSPMNLDFNIRLVLALKKEVDAVFRFHYAGYGGELSIDPDTAAPLNGSTMDIGRNDIAIFAGALFEGKKGVAGVEVGFRNVSYTVEGTIENPVSDTSKNNLTTTTFPIIRILGERKIIEWLTLLGSVEYQSSGRSTDINADSTIGTTDYETKGLSQSTVDINLGAIFSFDEFFIEGHLTRRIVFVGLPDSFTPLNASASVGYRF